MKLLLKNADGECVSVSVFPTDTFSDLKRRLSEEDNIDIDVNYFSIQGRPVESNLNVMQYLQFEAESDLNNKKKNTSDSNMCRLCAEHFQDSNLLDIYLLMDKIMACLPIQIEKNDLLSKLVCISCSLKLDETKKFIDSCVEAEKKQLSLLGEKSQSPAHRDCPICLIKETDDVSPLSTSEFLEAFKNHNHTCFKTNKEAEQCEEESTSATTGETDSPQVFCCACNQKVKLITHVRVEENETFTPHCFLCQESLKSSIELTEHLNDHYIEIIELENTHIKWKCKKCDIVSNDTNLFEMHFKCHERESQEKANDVEEDGSAQKIVYRCHLCTKSFRCKKRLEFHVQFHSMGAKAGQCSECRKEFATELCLYKHMLYNHLDPKVYTCEHCGKKFRNKSSLTYHFRSHSSLEAMKPFTCEVCKKRFARKNILRDHMMNRHGSNSEPQPRTCFQCHVCKEVFPNTDSAISHMEIHHPEKVDEKAGYSFDMLTISKLFVCEFCDKCFSLPVNLIEHRLRHGDTTKYQCKMCNEEFASFVELKTHQGSHASDGIIDYKSDFNISMLFMCPYCEKCFKNYQAFSIHGKSHNGEKPYKCRFCSQVFTSYCESANHRLSNHKTEKNAVFTTDSLKPFECQHCNKAFTSGSALTKHIRIHTGEKPYICRICNKSFAQSSGLYTHLKVHSNDRPYQCDLCSRSFKIIGDYKQHVRRHSGLRSYVCDVCKKSFMTQRSFSQHKKIHMNVRPYICDLCQQSFRRSHTLKIHKMRHARES